MTPKARSPYHIRLDGKKVKQPEPHRKKEDMMPGHARQHRKFKLPNKTKKIPKGPPSRAHKTVRDQNQKANSTGPGLLHTQVWYRHKLKGHAKL